jgi:hypothetical protein
LRPFSQMRQILVEDWHYSVQNPGDFRRGCMKSWR